MLKDYIVIDDVFEDPHSIAYRAKKMDYYFAPNCENIIGKYRHLNFIEKDESDLSWLGFRTNSIHLIDKKFFEFLLNSIFDKVFEKYKLNYEYTARAHFGIMPNGMKYEDGWLHQDNGFYAGVVYLNEVPTKDSGTIIQIDNKKNVVENKFNRMVLYNAKLHHAPQNSFVGDVDDRLILAFAIGRLQVTI